MAATFVSVPPDEGSRFHANTGSLETGPAENRRAKSPLPVGERVG
jgi:hypothetical protein